MASDKHLGGGEVLLWVTLGLGTGLLAGLALAEWVGGVSPGRMQRVAQRLRTVAPPRLTTAASARAVQAALAAEPRLAGLGIEAVPVKRGMVELRGWVPTRVARTLAGRTALATAGIESVINSILVRGEDDAALSQRPQATDQSA